jgi:hypothetical protein
MMVDEKVIDMMGTLCIKKSHSYLSMSPFYSDLSLQYILSPYTSLIIPDHDTMIIQCLDRYRRHTFAILDPQASLLL